VLASDSCNHYVFCLDLSLQVPKPTVKAAYADVDLFVVRG